ncbi:ABC transporter permease [Kibdelosporangium phytohabitans]|uniref:ABC transporter permease n=1 Tax=Kibdelosporangium phytohabitans TaxID=860235 RepID=A0A0N9ID79_9PSEU|nr:ABC transporter permease [Kibdelosporangium phytohabitans]ALG14365.1 hypothetical protein AOZ06_52555 [Kibdelosporangium phytohabitans]MBE1466602.1 ABC-2 type transport system permease protein [Kibdelosporangium phytohabitans]
MTLLAVERIKLFSTRSPWWCMALALGLMVGFAGLVSASASNAGQVSVPVSQFGFTFALAVILVLATLSVTTEYRFNTIKTTFQAVPSRTSALLAKTTVVAFTAGVLGVIAAFGSLGVATLIQPDADLALNSEADWRQVAGTGLVTLFAAVVAVSVGILIRQTAGAVSILLAYSLVAENLVQLIPSVGADIHKWLPFNVANRFLTGNPDGAGDFQGPGSSTSTLPPWAALAYFAGFSVVMLVIAIVVAKKRDA